MRYVFGFLVVVGLIIFVFYLILHGGGSNQSPKTNSFLDYATTDTVMRFTQEGVLDYDQNHRSIQITVGQDQNSIAILQGYQGQVISSNTYPNNEEAYSAFLHALSISGFTISQKSALSDVGACSGGNKYYFQIIDGSGDTIQNLWNSSCNEGSFGGNVGKIQSLFQDQIPDYSKQTTGVNLNTGS